MPYILDAHNGYWSQVIRADMAKGRTAQRACNDAFRAILMMGRGKAEALKVTQAAAHFAGVKSGAVNW